MCGTLFRNQAQWCCPRWLSVGLCEVLSTWTEISSIDWFYLECLINDTFWWNLIRIQIPQGNATIIILALPKRVSFAVGALELSQLLLLHLLDKLLCLRPALFHYLHGLCIQLVIPMLVISSCSHPWVGVIAIELITIDRWAPGACHEPMLRITHGRLRMICQNRATLLPVKFFCISQVLTMSTRPTFDITTHRNIQQLILEIQSLNLILLQFLYHLEVTII